MDICVAGSVFAGSVSNNGYGFHSGIILDTYFLSNGRIAGKLSTISTLESNYIARYSIARALVMGYTNTMVPMGSKYGDRVNNLPDRILVVSEDT